LHLTVICAASSNSLCDRLKQEVQAKEAELRQERERVLALSSAEAELGGRLQGAEERARGLESHAQELEGRLEEQRGQCRELEGARAAGEERLAAAREELLRAREQGSERSSE
jgi:chromosome segregation ATPase